MSNTAPYFRAFPLFCQAIATQMIANKTFNSDWFSSKQGQMRLAQTFDEGTSFEISLSTLELWCKGWVSQNKQEVYSPLKLAAKVLTVNA